MRRIDPWDDEKVRRKVILGMMGERYEEDTFGPVMLVLTIVGLAIFGIVDVVYWLITGVWIQ
jgi:hypothetical protein